MTQGHAAVILNSAINFLAKKHGVSDQEIADAMIARDEKICTQVADLMASLIAALKTE